MDITQKNRGRRTSLKEFERDLLEEGLLRLRPFFKKELKDKSLEQFIIDFITIHNENDELETIYTNTEEQQCESGLRRSGGDIFRICKYYYPECTLEEVLTILDKLIVSQETYNDVYIKSNMCRMIHKRVFVAYNDIWLKHADENDEFNRTVGQYSKQSTSDLELSLDESEEEEDDDWDDENF